MDTIRVELRNGGWAAIRPYLSHGTRVAVQGCLPSSCELVDGKVSMPGGDAIPQPVIDKANDTLVLRSVMEWSYGPVTEETLVEMPEEDYLVILGRITEAYRPLAVSPPGN